MKLLTLLTTLIITLASSKVFAQTYVCFSPLDQKPIKVNVNAGRDITITWNKYPITYDFILDTADIRVFGRMHSSETARKDYENLFDKNFEVFEKIQKELIVFDKKNMKISYSSSEDGVIKNVIVNCISLD